jgi:V-type H+-transporting ATPase subunit a
MSIVAVSNVHVQALSNCDHEVDHQMVSLQEALKATRLGFTAGTIDVENINAFERLLFRATRGNMFLRHSEVGTVTDPNTNKPKQKAVFVVFYAGERAKLKITKVCC